jgi:hypothetical protein
MASNEAIGTTTARRLLGFASAADGVVDDFMETE